MKYSIDEARKLGYGAILFFGHPQYYPRFGFVEAKEYGITDRNGNNFPAFMAMELKEAYLKNVFGKFIEADIYNDNLNREQARIFDIQFRSIWQVKGAIVFSESGNIRSRISYKLSDLCRFACCTPGIQAYWYPQPPIHKRAEGIRDYMPYDGRSNAFAR